MANQAEAETLQKALSSVSATQTEFPSAVDDVICFIANTGRNCFDWAQLKNLLVAKLRVILGDGSQEYNDDRDDVIKTLQNFGAAPFTLQRLCEILVEPTKHYTSKEKLLFAINKQTSVSSTLEPQPFPFEDAAAPQGIEVDGPAAGGNEAENAGDQMEIST
eukprot:CAMPEP_0174303560 /NCGR_PEP_ID=MMETSP0809-20121228/60257_1 /TAXON_ID=73025 ORGANISM="Eutreptiella gymnastica-like, Strain CCMP1594" /NCGR_SAMPLE_ID=MMETSP0809 /ASSEMBLY_ACC=CAM_ASM_000658 /LENGTH=161 /DNA_ID=CAMNT_0015409603 /DNA_START=25 /DNA_END=510 /DNA_ORIENTATION=-